MNIAFVSHDFGAVGGGGVENYLREVSRRLVHRGHHVHVVARRFDGGQPAEECWDGVAVHRLPFPLPRGLAVLFKPYLLAHRLVAPLAALFARFRPDVVVSRMALAGWSAWRAAGSTPHYFIPPALETNQDAVGMRSLPLRERLLTWWWSRASARIEREVAAGSAAVVVFSKNLRDQFVTYHRLPAGFARVVPPGVDHERFHEGAEPALRQGLGIAPDERVVLYLGRLRDEKGLAETISEVVTRSRRTWRLVVVGAGPQEDGLKRLAAPSGDRVLFPGFQNDPAPWYRAADVFLLPSLRESFGQVLLEAMASGLPCVARQSRLPAVMTAAGEVVVDGETGLLADGTDTRGLIDAVERLVDDPAACLRMGAAGRRRAVERYNWESHMDALLTAMA